MKRLASIVVLCAIAFALPLEGCAATTSHSSTTPVAAGSCKGCPPLGFGNILVRDANGVTRTYKTDVDGSGIQRPHVVIDEMPAVSVDVGDISIGAVTQGTAAADNAPWPVKLSDGTNPLGTAGNPVRTSPATSPADQPIVGKGTAGSPSGGVVSVQGVASGTPQPMSLSTIPLASNAASESTLAGVLTTTGFQGWLPKGQTTMASSLPVTIASNQTTVAVGGVAADGAAVSGNPVLQGGFDGTNAQSISTDTTGRQVVVGGAAAGAAIAGNPVLEGGSDGTNARAILTDTSGRQVEVGAASSGSTVAGAPVLIGGSDGTNARSLATDTSGRALAVATGAAAAGAAISGNPVMIGGSDGTNARALSTDTSGRAIAVGAAAAGASISGNPLLMGGSDGTLARALSTDTSGRAVAVGAAASGSAISGAPLLMGGSDGTNARAVSTDSSGRQAVIGAAASGSAAAGNPVLIAGNDGTNARSLKTATDGTLEAESQPSSATSYFAQITYTTSAGRIDTGTSHPLTRGFLLTCDTGPNDVYIGGSGVTSSNGFKVAAGQFFFFEETNTNNVYGISSASTVKCYVYGK